MEKIEFKEFLNKLKGCMNKLNDYHDKNEGIDSDIAGDIAFLIKEDIINDKMEYYDKIRNIIRLYYIVDFIYGLIFYKEEFNELLVIVRNIMGLIEDYGFLDD